MTHQLVSKHGEILAVNGPPGTGKTTLVLSVVASHWVRAALDGTEPPVIAAASTNNQAVTNIIDAFAKDFSPGAGPFAGRWLPEIQRFGAYFPAVDKEDQAARKYQTKAFFNSVEEAGYLARAEGAYLKAASAAFPDLTEPTVQSVVDLLGQAIRDEVDKLVVIEKTWTGLKIASQERFAELGDNPDAALSARQQAVADTKQQVAALETLKDQWESHLAKESWFYALFSRFARVARKRLLIAKVFLKTVWPEEFPAPTWTSVEELSTQIETLFNEYTATLKDRDEAVQVANAKIQAVTKAMRFWTTAVEPLAQNRPPETLSLAACDRAADTVIR